MENFEMWIVGYGIVYDTAFGPDIGFVRFEITKPTKSIIGRKSLKERGKILFD